MNSTPIVYTVPTYSPYTTGREEYGDPQAKIEILSEEGIRLNLLRPGLDAVDDKCPTIVAERRPNGWAIFLHSDGGDAVGVVRIHDDGRSALERDRCSTQMEIASPGDDATFSVD